MPDNELETYGVYSIPEHTEYIEGINQEVEKFFGKDSPEVWQVAKNLRSEPERVIYPTQEMGLWFPVLLSQYGYGSINHREFREFHGQAFRELHYLQRPHTVREFVTHALRGIRDEERRNSHYERLEPEKKLAAFLLGGLLTTDPTEADLSLEDHFTDKSGYGHEPQYRPPPKKTRKKRKK